MGLRMTLPKEKNGLYTDFIDAYWCVRNIAYSTDEVGGELLCFPSREASQMQGLQLDDPYLSVGGPSNDHVYAVIYSWQFLARITDIFPSGIPLNADMQKTAIYNWIKAYTQMPFEDVFEEE